MTEKEMVERAQELGWTVETTMLFDEEQVEGWLWTSPEGYETYLVGDWNKTPVLPMTLFLEFRRENNCLDDF
jgi:hypothetical protein